VSHCCPIAENISVTTGDWHWLFDADRVLDDPVTTSILLAIAMLLALTAPAARLLFALRWIDDRLYEDVMRRWQSWLWLVLLMVIPLLLGQIWVMGTVAVISVLCYGEYARATGLAKEKVIHGVIILAIAAVTFAVMAHEAELFFAAAALSVALIAIVTIAQDRPQGFLQRLGPALLGFLLFGYFLGYLGYIANDRHYRPILLLIVLSVELNDVFAFCIGKGIGGRRLIPNTSPAKTVAGSVGALALTMLLVVGLGRLVFAGTPADRLDYLLILGAMISILGQFGDLLVSAIKRDLGIKDMGSVVPGHGGLLDRFDSLVLVAPAVFHYLSWQLGPLGSGPHERLFTGGW
jgi:phosphatidate cytidylyltransferase